MSYQDDIFQVVHSKYEEIINLLRKLEDKELSDKLILEVRHQQEIVEQKNKLSFSLQASEAEYLNGYLLGLSEINPCNGMLYKVQYSIDQQIKKQKGECKNE